MKIKPIEDRILVEIKQYESEGGLESASKSKLDEGVVIAISPLVEEMGHVKVGDTVLLKDYDTDEVEVEGKKLTFIRQEHVLGIKTE